MPETESKQSFWSTLPGILTGLAAVLTAVTGLWAVLHHASPAAEPPRQDAAIVDGATAGSRPGPAKSAGSPEASSLPPTPAPTGDGTVTVIARDGVTTQLALKSFQHNGYDKELTLISGQSVPFDKIRTIDFGAIDAVQDNVAVTLTLVDGRSLPGSVQKNFAFKGENDLGPFSIFLHEVKQVTFNR